MKKLRKTIINFILVVCLLMSGLYNHAVFANTAETENEQEECKYYNWNQKHYDNYMQSTGEARVLVLMVDFPDDLHKEEHDKQYVEDLFFGEGDSVKSFFDRSSYGQLSFTGDVYGWYTAKNNRESYVNENSAASNIFDEIIENMGDEIDFSKYDANNDGVIDNIYIYYSSSVSDKGTQWWSYMSTFNNKETDGVIANTYAFIQERREDIESIPMEIDSRIIVHETGHCMGLNDYYAESHDYMMSIEACMMSDHSYDFVAFSKILLGWINPMEITQNGEYNLAEMYNNASAAIIYPNGDKESNSFLVVEYNIPVMGTNQSRSGIRVFKVNARNDNFHFLQTPYDDIKFIDLVISDMKSGEYIDDSTTPSTILKDIDENGIYVIPSGIKISCGEQDADSANISVEYSQLDNIELEYDTKIEYANNQVALKLEFNQPVSVVNNDIVIAAANGDTFEAEIFSPTYNSAMDNQIFIISGGPFIENEDYQIIIPEGTILGKCQSNDRIEIPFHTSRITDVTGKYIGEMAFDQTQDFFEEEDRVVFFQFDDNKKDLCMYEIKDNELTNKKVISSFEYSESFVMPKACKLVDGTYVIALTRDGLNTIIKVKPDGNIEEVYKDASYIAGKKHIYMILPLGNKVLIVLDSLKNIILDENNEITEFSTDYNGYGEMLCYPDSVFRIGKDRFLISNSKRSWVVDGDNNIEFVKENRHYKYIEVLENQIRAIRYSEGDGIYLEIINESLDVLSSKKIMDIYGNVRSIERVSYGYVIGCNFYNNGYIPGDEFSMMSCKEISGILIVNNDWEVESTVTLFDKSKYNDGLVNLAVLNDNRIVVINKSSFYTTEAFELECVGHVEVVDEAVEATCETEGKTEGSHCSVCGKVIKAQTTVPSTGHSEVVDEAVEATCETEGKTEGSHCSVCGKVIKAQETVDKKDHEYENGHCIYCGRSQYTASWIKDDNGWKYRNEDGTFVNNGWKAINSKWYYFDGEGYMQTGWKQIDGSWYYFNNSGYMVTGWLRDGNKWYYLESNGKMASNKWVNSVYYMKSNGAMAVNEWVDGGRYYVDLNGKWVPNKTKASWKKDAKGWWYDNGDGTYPKSAWKSIDGSWYYFNNSGYMVTGWLNDGGKWYYLESNGRMASSKWIGGTYYVKANGVMATNEWVDGGRYYVDANGKWVVNKTA